MKGILIVAAHPDDEVLGCFGTVAKMIRNGYEAYTLVLSGGKASRSNVDRKEIQLLKKEMRKANAEIGIREVFQENFPDNAFDSVPLLDIVKAIETVKDRVAPEVVFTHHVGDLNIDHQLTHRAVLTATRPMKGECVKTIYAMEVPSSTEWNGFSRDTVFVPNVFFDISETLDLKLKAMAHYASELRDYPHPRSLQHIRELAIVNGTKVGLTCSENFMLLRSIHG